MTTTALMRPGYRMHLLMWAGIFVLMGMWFCYDGFYEWPDQREIARRYNELAQQDRLDQWPALAAQKGWPQGSEDSPPGKDRSDGTILAQKIIAASLMVPGLVILLYYLRSFRNSIKCDATTLTTSWGQATPLASITKLDTRRWDAKGIAVVHYQRSGAKDGRLVLDDWKYQTKQMRQIVKTLQEHLGLEAEDTSAEDHDGGGADEKQTRTTGAEPDGES